MMLINERPIRAPQKCINTRSPRALPQRAEDRRAPQRAALDDASWTK
jgi:hypothetical protein